MTAAPQYDRIISMLAIDPGAHTGWAYFHDGVLLDAGVTTPDKQPLHPIPDLVVIECPARIYDHATAASIIKLARVTGRYEERYCNAPIELVEPRTWKGTIDGDIMVNRIKAAFTPHEAAVAARFKGGYAHNMVDAIGLGKWSLRQPFMRRRG